MIKFIKGNIFENNAEAIVNTVNTVGVMGKGVALQFKEKYPENYKLYHKACEKGEVVVGKMFVTPTNSLMNPIWIINFPTKKNWIHSSSYDYIENGLDDLIKVIKQLNIQSIAIPPLGAGQGGLDWEKVKQIIQNKLSDLDIEIEIYEPVTNSFAVNSNSGSVNLTKPRALVLALVEKYKVLGFDISLLEIQKLAYFLQRVGQTELKLNFKKSHYGPYAHNLQHLLHKLENDYILTSKSILDSKPYDTIYFNTQKTEELKKYIETNCSDIDKTRFGTVEKIMEGFESPFGLELLATVDWIINENKNSNKITAEFIKEKIKDWSKRKDISFSIEHIQLAFQHLNKYKNELSYHN